MNIEKNITREYINSKVSDYQIFSYYYPGKFTFNRTCKNCFVHEDHPSMIIGEKGGDVIFKCFNSEHRGDAFSFVQQLFSISYSEAINKIAEDFGLKERKSTKYESVISALPQTNIIKKRNIIHAKEGELTWSHIEYLNNIYLTIEDMNFCEDTKVYPLGEMWINRRRASLKKDEMAFYYHLKNERGEWIKIYRPFASRDDKWKSTIPITEIMGLSCLEKCDVLVITKSLKEAALLKKHLGLCVLVVQSENVACFTPENTKIINENSKKVFLSFDSDPPGVRASKLINEATGWGWVNVPNKYLKQRIKDWAELVENYGVEEMRNVFKKKGVI